MCVLHLHRVMVHVHSIMLPTCVDNYRVFGPVTEPWSAKQTFMMAGFPECCKLNHLYIKQQSHLDSVFLRYRHSIFIDTGVLVHQLPCSNGQILPTRFFTYLNDRLVDVAISASNHIPFLVTRSDDPMPRFSKIRCAQKSSVCCRVGSPLDSPMTALNKWSS